MDENLENQIVLVNPGLEDALTIKFPKDLNKISDVNYSLALLLTELYPGASLVVMVLQ